MNWHPTKAKKKTRLKILKSKEKKSKSFFIFGIDFGVGFSFPLKTSTVFMNGQIRFNTSDDHIFLFVFTHFAIHGDIEQDV